MTRRLTPLFLLGAIVLAPTLAYASPSAFDSARSHGWVWAYLAVFAAGFVTSLTPCVYPMIPIVVGIFGAKQAKSRVRAFGLATMYVLGMGVTYSVLGVAVALTGRAFGEVLANPYVIVPIVLLYCVLAASMFGAFEMNLPPSLQAKLSGVGGKGTFGAFGMGLVGGLTAAPCTGPMLAGILAFIGTTRNVPLGFTIMFTYAVGMGILFWVIATFAVALPKSGRWMEVVKVIAGTALLVVGAYFLRPIWPALRRVASPKMSFLVGSSAIAVVGLAAAGFYVFLKHETLARAMKGGGIALSVAGLVGVVNWTLTPKHPVEWRHDHEVAISEAAAKHQPVVLDFGAEYCKPCKLYETAVFSDPDVYGEMTSKFVPVKVDMTHPTQADFDEKSLWQASALPTVIILGPDGKERARFAEPLPSAQEFLKALRSAE